MRANGRWRGGMTLVELLVALVVSVIAGMGILGAYHFSLQLAEETRGADIALQDLAAMTERIKATPLSQLQAGFPSGAPNGVVGAGVDLYSAIIGGYRLEQETITVTHTPTTSSDPRQLTVQVRWQNQGRTYQQTVHTVRTSQAT